MSNIWNIIIKLYHIYLRLWPIPDHWHCCNLPWAKWKCAIIWYSSKTTSWLLKVKNGSSPNRPLGRSFYQRAVHKGRHLSWKNFLVPLGPPCYHSFMYNGTRSKKKTHARGTGFILPTPGLVLWGVPIAPPRGEMLTKLISFLIWPFSGLRRLWHQGRCFNTP